MSIKNIKIQVDINETDLLISGMYECRYKYVYELIESLKEYKEQGNVNGLLNIKLGLEQAQETLAVIVQKPFCEVYKLVDKINEKIQALTAVNETTSVSVDNGDIAQMYKVGLANSVLESLGNNTNTNYLDEDTVSFITQGKNSPVVQPEAVGKKLSEVGCDQL